MKTLIGITGQKYAGKDTTGLHISKLTNYPLYAFAKPLKDFCKTFFDLNYEELYDSKKEVIRSFNLKSWKDFLISVISFQFPELLESQTEDKIIDSFYRRVLLPYLIGENETNQTANLLVSSRNIMQKVGTDFFRGLQPDIWLKQADKALLEYDSLIVTDLRFDNEAQWIKNNFGLIINVLRDLDNNDPHISEQGIDNKYVDIHIENNGTIEELENGIEMIVNYKILQSNTLSLKDIF